jgi:hypothetical protein
VAHSQDQDIPEVVLEDMEGLEDLVDTEVPAEEMQETTEVVEEKGTVTAVVGIAMADAADGSRCKT